MQQDMSTFQSIHPNTWRMSILHVLDLVSRVHDVILMNVYLDLGNTGGSGFWNGGYMSKGREIGRSVYKQPGNEVNGSYHSKEGSK
jgi:hypothetical protein